MYNALSLFGFKFKASILKLSSKGIPRLSIAKNNYVFRVYLFPLPVLQPNSPTVKVIFL